MRYFYLMTLMLAVVVGNTQAAESFDGKESPNGYKPYIMVANLLDHRVFADSKTKRESTIIWVEMDRRIETFFYLSKILPRDLPDIVINYFDNPTEELLNLGSLAMEDPNLLKGNQNQSNKLHWIRMPDKNNLPSWYTNLLSFWINKKITPCPSSICELPIPPFSWHKRQELVTFYKAGRDEIERKRIAANKQNLEWEMLIPTFQPYDKSFTTDFRRMRMISSGVKSRKEPIARAAPVIEEVD